MKIHMDIKNWKPGLQIQRHFAHNKFQKNQRKYALLVTSYCCVLLIISFPIGVINFEINLSYLIKTFSKM